MGGFRVDVQTVFYTQMYYAIVTPMHKISRVVCLRKHIAETLCEGVVSSVLYIFLLHLRKAKNKPCWIGIVTLE